MESAITINIQGLSKEFGKIYHHSGFVTVNGTNLIYRAFEKAPGVFNVGT